MKNKWKWSLVVFAMIAVSSLMVACGKDDEPAKNETNCTGNNAYNNPACYGSFYNGGSLNCPPGPGGFPVCGAGGINPNSIPHIDNDNYVGDFFVNGLDMGRATVRIQYSWQWGFIVEITSDIGGRMDVYATAVVDQFGRVSALVPYQQGSQGYLKTSEGDYILKGIMVATDGLIRVDLTKSNSLLGGIIRWGTSGSAALITNLNKI